MNALLQIQSGDLPPSSHYLGSGKFGRVYASRYKDCDVAYKVMKRGIWVRMFINELNILRSLQGHDGIVRLYGYCISPTKMAIVMEQAKGMTLVDLISCGGIGYRNMLRICRQVASTMVYIHAKNILYCDLKPDNILIDPDTYATKLIDFGFSIQLECPNMVAWGEPCGTIGYTAPEIISYGRFSKAGDVYAFGVMVYVLYTGNAPHRVSRMKKLLKRRFDYDIFTLFCRCTSEIPRYRPTFVRIYNTLRKMEKKYDWYQNISDKAQRCLCCLPHVFLYFLRSMFQTPPPCAP